MMFFPGRTKTINLIDVLVLSRTKKTHFFVSQLMFFGTWSIDCFFFSRPIQLIYFLSFFLRSQLN